MKTKSAYPKEKWNFLDYIQPHATDFPTVELVKHKEPVISNAKKPVHSEIADAISNASLTSPSQSINKENKTKSKQKDANNRDLQDEFTKMYRKITPNDKNFVDRMAFDIYKRSTVLDRLENYVKAKKPKQLASQETFNRLYEDSKKKKELSTEKTDKMIHKKSESIAKQISPATAKKPKQYMLSAGKTNYFTSFVQKVSEDCDNRKKAKCLSQNVSPEEVKSETVLSARPKSMMKSPSTTARKCAQSFDKSKYNNLSRAIKDVLNEEVFTYVPSGSTQSLLSKYDINAVEICKGII